MSDSLEKPENKPLVSVIIPCYKMGRYIGQALESVGKQNYKNWEVIAVDDCGPEDGTNEIVERFARQFPNNRVLFHRHAINQGVSAARNSAIALSQGEYLAFIDPDDFWLEEHIYDGISVFNSKPEIGVTVSPVVAFWDDGKKPDVLWAFDGWVGRWFPNSLGAFNFIQPSGVLVRKCYVDEVGGFVCDRELQHIEDYDLWIKLVMKNVQFEFLGRSTCRYRRHSNASSSNLNFTNALHRNLMKKHSGFFLREQGKLIIQLAQKVEKMEQKTESNLFRSIKRFLRLAQRNLGG